MNENKNIKIKNVKSFIYYLNSLSNNGWNNNSKENKLFIVEKILHGEDHWEKDHRWNIIRENIVYTEKPSTEALTECLNQQVQNYCLE